MDPTISSLCCNAVCCRVASDLSFLHSDFRLASFCLLYSSDHLTLWSLSRKDCISADGPPGTALEAMWKT